jgi:hypothetical protein
MALMSLLVHRASQPQQASHLFTHTQACIKEEEIILLNFIFHGSGPQRLPGGLFGGFGLSQTAIVGGKRIQSNI